MNTIVEMQESLYRWRLVYAGPRGEHRLFVDDASGRLAVVDNSGRLPTECDDGVLWLPLTQVPIIVSRLHVRMTVVRERRPDDVAFVGTHVGLAIAVGFRVFTFNNLTMRLDDEK